MLQSFLSFSFLNWSPWRLLLKTFSSSLCLDLKLSSVPKGEPWVSSLLDSVRNQVGSSGEWHFTVKVSWRGKQVSASLPPFLCDCRQLIEGFSEPLLMCLLSLPMGKWEYFVSYLKLKLFASSQFSHSVSGQLPRTWIPIRAGASLWFFSLSCAARSVLVSFSCAEEGRVQFRMLVTRGPACIWIWYHG